MVFERELALGGLVDRLDPLADPAELAESGLLVAAVGSDEGGIEFVHGVLELAAGEPFVGDDDFLAHEQPLTARPGAAPRRPRPFSSFFALQTEGRRPPPPSPPEDQP